MYIGIVKNMKAICMPPIAMKTFLLPSASSQFEKKREKTRP
jgi:hypothetical protein